jgi:hypothetical protein
MSNLEKEKKASQIYNEKMNLDLDQSAVDLYVCIEPESEEHFLGKTEIEAIEKAKAKYPDRFVYVAKVQKKPLIVIRQAN